MWSIGYIMVMCGMCLYLASCFMAGLLLDSNPKVVKFADIAMAIMVITGIPIFLIGVALNILGI